MLEELYGSYREHGAKIRKIEASIEKQEVAQKIKAQVWLV